MLAPDFSTYDNRSLVLAYGEIARELRTVFGCTSSTCPERKSFRSKTAGVAECNKLWAKVQELRGVNKMDEVTSTTTEIPDLPTVPAATPKKKRAGTKKGPPGTNGTKKAKATKTAKKTEKKAAGPKGRAPLFPDNAKLKVLSKDDPTREGTSSREYWTMIKKSSNFGAYRALGGNLKYLYWFRDRGHVSIG